MEMPTFIYKVLPSKKKEELISKRNVRVIKEYLVKRKKLESAKKGEMARLRQLRKSKSISASTYRSLKQVVVMARMETKRIELINASMEKSVKLQKSVVSFDNEPIKPINY